MNDKGATIDASDPGTPVSASARQRVDHAADPSESLRRGPYGPRVALPDRAAILTGPGRTDDGPVTDLAALVRRVPG